MVNNGKTKEKLAKKELTEIELSLKKVKEVLAKYDDPFEGKNTLEVLKMIRGTHSLIFEVEVGPGEVRLGLVGQGKV